MSDIKILNRVLPLYGNMLVLLAIKSRSERLYCFARDGSVKGRTRNVKGAMRV